MEKMVEIVFSRQNHEIENEIFERAIASYQSGEEVYLLVPEQFTLQNEIELMQRLGGGAVSNIRIISFQRLALETLSSVGGLKRKYIDSMGKTMVLKNILYRHQEKLKLYAGSIAKEGFVDALLRQLAELKRSRIDSDMLREYAEKLKDSELLSQKLTELAFIQELVEEKLADKYVDNDDRLGQLAEAPALPNLASKHILIYSFLDFTAVEKQILKNMMHHARKMTIGLCLDRQSVRDKEEMVFTSTEQTLFWLKETASEEGIPLRLEMLENKEYASRDLQFLGEQLFRVISKEYPEESQNIHLFAAHSLDDEIHHIAIQISKMVVEENYRYRDLMVVAGDLQAYGSTIKQVFELYKIPFFIDEKRSIINSPIVKVIIAAMNLLNGEFTVENIMVFLKNDIRYMGHQVSNLYHFENYILAKKLKRKMFLEDRYFDFASLKEGLSDERMDIEISENQNQINLEDFASEQSLGKDAPVDSKDTVTDQESEDRMMMSAVEKIRAELLDLFSGPMKAVEGQQDAAFFGELLYKLLEKQGMVEKIQQLLDDLRKDHLLDEANENGQIWNIFVRIIEQAAEIFGDEKMTFSTYRDLVIQAIQSHRLAVIPPSQDQVVVGDVERSRSSRKKVVFICGMNSGSIPSGYKDSGILTQSEKHILDQSGMSLPSEREHVDANEQLMLYLLFTRATEKLFLSYSSENAKLPSALVGEIQKIFPDLPIKTPRDCSAIELVSMPKPTIHQMAREIKKMSKGEQVDPLWQEALNYYRSNATTRQMTQSALDGIFYDNRKMRIQSAQHLYPTPMKLSTTRLRTYEECPFKHFVKYGLRAKERKEYSIEPSEMGLVLHKTVEEVVRLLKNEPQQIATISQEEMDRLVEEYFESATHHLLKEYDLAESRNQFMLKRLKKTAKKIAITSVEHLREGEFQLFAQEAVFDENQDIPPIIIQVNGHEIKLTGTIDRIDVLQEDGRSYIKVIDYKTSNKEFSLSDAYNGLDIQLLVYLSAAMQSKKLVKDERFPGGVFYFPVTDPIIETQERSKEELQHLIKSHIKMDGLVLNEAAVLQGLDRELAQNSKSDVFHSTPKHRLSKRQFDALMAHVHSNIARSLQEILEGEISAYPIIQNGNKEAVGCRFCRYAGICRFEEELGDSYRPLYKYDNEEILQQLERAFEGKVKNEESMDSGSTTSD